MSWKEWLIGNLRVLVLDILSLPDSVTADESLNLSRSLFSDYKIKGRPGLSWPPDIQKTLVKLSWPQIPLTPKGIYSLKTSLKPESVFHSLAFSGPLGNEFAPLRTAELTAGEYWPISTLPTAGLRDKQPERCLSTKQNHDSTFTGQV